LAYDETLADRVRATLAGRDGLTERKMFGGVAFMLNGNMACGLTSLANGRAALRGLPPPEVARPGRLERPTGGAYLGAEV
jgi:hypothetical protein